MKVIKIFLFDIYLWYFWHNFHNGLKYVLGHKNLASSLKEMREIEKLIREKNGLQPDENILWEHNKKAGLELFGRYVTLKHFNEIGEMLSFFRAVDKKKLIKGE
jgi:hypothetical protein